MRKEYFKPFARVVSDEGWTFCANTFWTVTPTTPEDEEKDYGTGKDEDDPDVGAKGYNGLWDDSWGF